MSDHGREYERRQETQERIQAPEAPTPEAPLERLASAIGNQAFGMIARQGDGILPNGRAHPDVEAAIARTRGGGNPLDGGVAEKVGPKLGDDFSDVRVHTDGHADALARSVSARAFTTGSDLYFAKGEYQPHTSHGDDLLAHELTHVVQQRGAPTGGPLMVSMPGDAMEVEAESATRGL